MEGGFERRQPVAFFFQKSCSGLGGESKQSKKLCGKVFWKTLRWNECTDNLNIYF